MYCGNCGNTVNPQERFCKICGSSLRGEIRRPEAQYIEEKRKLVCLSCGKEARTNTKFCSGCGKALPAEVVKRIPLCVMCGEKLPDDSKECESCGTTYKEATDGYITIEESCCGNCGTPFTEEEAFCSECGEDLSKNAAKKQKKFVAGCKNCGEEIDMGKQFCVGCGEPLNVGKVKPILVGDRISCPVCGEKGMPANRKVCFGCGVEFLPPPWVCKDCGKTNYYSSDVCIYCHPEAAASKVKPKPVVAVSAEPLLSPPKPTLSKPQQKKPSISDYPMKWYYFLIYGYLIACAIGGFISGLVDLFSGSVFFGLLWIATGIDALVSRGRLARRKTHGPASLLGYFIWAFALNMMESFVSLNQMSKYQRETEGTILLLVMFGGAIGTLIMVCCNASYFKKRKDLFVN